MKREESARAAAERRLHILGLLAGGLSRREVAEQLGISTQRLFVILRRVPASDLEAAIAAGAGKVRCPHCGLWVAKHEAGAPRRHRD